MKTVVLITVLNVLGCVFTYPISGQNDLKSCYTWPPERQNRLNTMIEEVGDFLRQISQKYEDIDIPDVKLTVENHPKAEDGEINLSVIINDCDEATDEEIQEWVENSEEATSDDEGIADDNNDADDDESEYYSNEDSSSEFIDDGLDEAGDDENVSVEASPSPKEEKKGDYEVEIVTFNDEETKVLEELEEARGTPFVMFERDNGQRIIY